MQPPYNALTSDAYGGHHRPQDYFSYFPTTQNPNPYHHHHHHHPHQLQLQPGQQYTADPTPPGVDSYYSTPSYPLTHHAAAAASYDAHYYNTYSAAATAAAAAGTDYAAADLVARQWLAAEDLSVHQQYGTTVPQDASQQILPAMPTYSTWTNPNPTTKPHGAWKKIPKKTKIVQSAWCELCKTECTTTDILYKHRSGKKHLKNLEKLMQATAAASTSALTPVNQAVPSNPIIGPPEKPKNGNLGIKKKVETPADLEKKKRKVLEGGAAAYAVRTCQICNVVCNSDTVFRYHLAGQKHASMVKKLQQVGVV